MIENFCWHCQATLAYVVTYTCTYIISTTTFTQFMWWLQFIHNSETPHTSAIHCDGNDNCVYQLFTNQDEIFIITSSGITGTAEVGNGKAQA